MGLSTWTTFLVLRTPLNEIGTKTVTLEFSFRKLKGHQYDRSVDERWTHRQWKTVVHAIYPCFRAIWHHLPCIEKNPPAVCLYQARKAPIRFQIILKQGVVIKDGNLHCCFAILNFHNLRNPCFTVASAISFISFNNASEIGTSFSSFINSTFFIRSIFRKVSSVFHSCEHQIFGHIFQYLYFIGKRSGTHGKSIGAAFIVLQCIFQFIENSFTVCFWKSNRFKAEPKTMVPNSVFSTISSAISMALSHNSGLYHICL